MKPSDYCIITTTTDNQENANIIIEALLQEKLVVSVQESKGKVSYGWKGKIISADEFVLQMKTKVSLFQNVKDKIKELHTYDVPEITMVTLSDASFSYLEWIEKKTCNKNEECKDINEEEQPPFPVPLSLEELK